MNENPSTPADIQNSTIQPEGTAPVPSKGKRKPFVIVALVVVIILLLTAGALAAVYWYSNNNNQEPDEEINTGDQESNDDETADETENNEETEVTCDKLTPQVDVEYLEEPETIDQFEVFTEDVNGGIPLEEEDYDFYMTGSVVSGLAWDEVDLTGYDVVVIANKEDSSEYVKLLANPDRSRMYTILFDFGFAGGMSSPFRAEVILGEDGYSAGVLPQDIDFMNLVPSVAEGQYWDTNVYLSDNGNYYNYADFFASNIAELNLGEAVDSICGYDIYLSDDGMNYLTSDDGFAYRMLIFPTIYPLAAATDYTQEYEPDITWSEGLSAEQSYDYISVGGCGINQELELTSLTSAQLRKVGEAANGDAIYVPIDANETYQKKVYDEDYIEAEMWEYNPISEDDSAPFDYATFLSYHPVFYWEDPFGRYIKFVSRSFVMTGGCAKPAIYLYPEETTDIHVQVIPNGQLRFTQPAYPRGGWQVQAHPTGKIFNYADAQYYDYLWWDSVAWNVRMPEEGFIVEKTDISAFLDNTLQTFGLNSKEINDFKGYWLDRMYQENTDYVKISFLFNEDVNQIARLKFDAQPDIVMRLFMFYTPLDQPISIQPQQIPEMHRTGFTVVEWGGAKGE